MVKAALPLARRLNRRRSCRLDSKPPTLLLSSASTFEPTSPVPMTTTCVYPDRDWPTTQYLCTSIVDRVIAWVIARELRSAFGVQCPFVAAINLGRQSTLGEPVRLSGVRIRRHPWPPLVAKARFWSSDQMRPTGAGAVYPATAADGARGRRPSTSTLTTQVDRRSRPPAHRRYNCLRRKPTIRTPVRARPVGPLGQVVCRHRNSRPSPRAW